MALQGHRPPGIAMPRIGDPAKAGDQTRRQQ